MVNALHKDKNIHCLQKKSINFTVYNKKFCLSLHYNGANSYLFIDGIGIYEVKVKDSEIIAIPLCLGNISKHWTVDNMKRLD